jgi:lipooligosaccharide transport system permease protein
MSAASLAWRRLAPTRAGLVYERNAIFYRRVWRVIFSGFFEPVFYLFAVGIGIGKLVGALDVDGRQVEYASFVAPALLAASSMNGAVADSTFNVFEKLRWSGAYETMLATPIAPRDIAFGEIAWSQTRGLIYSVGFLVVATVFGLVESWTAILALPAAMLLGFAFAGMGMAATTFMRTWQDFDYVNLVTLPLFLFSATFYPIDVYPDWLQQAALVSPLYHGVVLIRGAMLGTWDVAMIGHAVVLVALAAAGLAVAARRIERLLVI